MRDWSLPGCLLPALVLGALTLPGAVRAHGPAPAAESGAGRACSLQLLAGEREPLPGRQALDEWLATHPTAKPLTPTRAQQDDIAVGTQLPFPVAGSPFLVSASCQYVGDHVYIFVEDASWDLNGGSIIQYHVDALGALFDRSSPADADRGVYELVTEAFGPPPDVDGYERIFVLILDIPDPRLVGFFDPAVASHEVPELRRDVLHIDQVALRLRSYLARGTLAHEFQHLIHWGLDRDEDLWVNEGLSGYAEEVAGFPEADPKAVPAFLARPGTALMTWQNTPQNYGMTYLFMSFLAEKYGPEVIRYLVAEPRNGRNGVDGALAAAGAGADFDEVWSRWLVGNYAGEDPQYGYAATLGRRVATLPVTHLPQDWAGAAVDGQWGSTTVVFRTPGDVTVQFDGGDTGVFRAWAYAMRGGFAELRELALGPDNRGAVTAAGIDSLALVVGRTSRAGREFQVAATRAVPTAVAADLGQPQLSRLEAAYPNPFNSTVRVPLVLAEAGQVRLVVHDVLGRRVRVLHRGPLPAGRHELAWDGLDQRGVAAASGPYFLQLEWHTPESGPAPPATPSSTARIILIR